MLMLAIRIGSALLGLLPHLAMADYGAVNTAVVTVGSELPGITGMTCSGAGCGFIAIALTILDRFRPLVTVAAGLVITIFGVKMITAQDQESFDKVRPMMTGLISGLVLLWLIEPFIYAFYGETGEVFTSPAGIEAGITIINDEVTGLINWALTITAVIAVFMMVVIGLKSILKPTAEDSISAIRKTIVSIFAGIMLLLFHATIASRFVDNTQSPVPLLEIPLKIISFLMGFLALASVIMFVYVGINLLLNMGKDEAWTQAKGLLIRTAIGFVLIITSLGIVNFILIPAVS